jgi:hypothetical protein
MVAVSVDLLARDAPDVIGRGDRRDLRQGEADGCMLLKTALEAAMPGRAPAWRDLAMSVIVVLTSDTETDRGEDFTARVNRLIYP